MAPAHATAGKALGGERGRDKTTADEPGCPGPRLLKRGREHRRTREAQGTGRVTAKGPGEGSRQGPEPRSAQSVERDRQCDSAGRTGMREATSLENAINGREQIDAHDTGNSHPRPPGLAVKDTAPVHPESSHSPTRAAKAPRRPGEGSPACCGGCGRKGSQRHRLALGGEQPRLDTAAGTGLPGNRGSR